MQDHANGTIVTRQCRDCKEWKTKDAFYPSLWARTCPSIYCKTCMGHRQRQVRERRKAIYWPPAPDYQKRCPYCQEVKFSSCFNRSSRENDGLQDYCKSCRKYIFMLRTYGMNRHEYKKLLKKQEYRCDICKRDLETVGRGRHLDHCHKTGKVRGVLCVGCNFGLAGFKDNPIFLESAAAYIRKYTGDL